jgi:tetratricopeptide (TPR) repeat protein
MITALDSFRRCIELCREHGYGRIEIANQYMVAWNRLYLNEVDGALEDGLAAIESAVRIGHQRAELVAELAVARALVEKGEGEAVEAHAARGLALAEALGANRFTAFHMIFLGRDRLTRDGRRAEAAALMEEALEISRHTGISFLGPWVLGTLALASDDPERSRQALAEAEELLRDGCVGHNYFGFYRDAMEVALRAGEWDEVERYARALTDSMGDEPVPWGEYYIARARALAAHGQGRRDEAMGAELARLNDEAARSGLKLAQPALEAALASA